MSKEKVEVYDVKLVYRVRTKAQAKELVKHMNQLFRHLTNEWCKVKLPKNFGKIKGLDF